jgi:hypothetical protein
MPCLRPRTAACVEAASAREGGSLPRLEPALLAPEHAATLARCETIAGKLLNAAAEDMNMRSRGNLNISSACGHVLKLLRDGKYRNRTAPPRKEPEINR